MPIRDLLIVESSSAILEPISQQMVYTILSRLGLRYTFENNIYITNDYTKPSITSDDDSHNALISKDRCNVKMEVVWNPTEVKWDINSFNLTQAYGIQGSTDKTLVPVLIDPQIDVYVVEQQVPCSMTLSFSLQFKNRESAFMAISAITNTSFRDSIINTHNLSYNYPITNELFICLHEIYKLRKNSMNQGFWTYLTRCSRGGTQYLQQRTGDKVELVVKRQDIRAIGVLEHTQSAPTVEEQDRGIDRFIVEFTYTLQFARPDVLRLSFPVVINNQLVPNWMLPPPIESELAKVTAILQERSIFGYLQSTSLKPSLVVRRPEYDDFKPPIQPITCNGFREFFNAVVLLDDTPTTTIDLLNLGFHTQLHDTVVQIMKLQGSSVFETTGLINLMVYCNDIPVDQSLLSIDENLVLTIAMQDRLRRYHLVISEATDLNLIDSKWFRTLIEYRTFFPITIIRNLQILIEKNFCYIDHHNKVLLLINDSIHNFSIDSQIQALIAAGHLNHYAYSYTATAEQFAQYLMQIISPVSGRKVYDEYIHFCIQSDLLTEAQLATGYIRQSNGYPFLSTINRSVVPNFNIPLRVLESQIVINRQPV